MKNKIIFAIAITATIFLVGCTQQLPFGSRGNMAPLQMYTLAEVSQHNSTTDCWIVLRNKVYNVTDLIAKNPDNNFSNECGKEVTFGFGARPPRDNNVNRPRPPGDFNDPRPPGDFNMQRPGGRQNPLFQYYIGDLQS